MSASRAVPSVPERTGETATTAHAYYNEFDPFAAAWLRELIARRLIAPGDVDERSIAEVQPADLVGYTQCHFFAGIGVWSHALRSAGWPDERPVWTGSCPCQPFSAAGKGLGTADARHLWPEFARLIGERRPPVVFGEQVASAAGRAWLDAVQADLEALDYACGAADLCAAGVGAAHIRQRLYWVADAASAGRRPAAGRPITRDSDATPVAGEAVSGRRCDARGLANPVLAGRAEGWPIAGLGSATGGGIAGGLADTDDAGSQGHVRSGDLELHGAAEPIRPARPNGAPGGMADAERERVRSCGPGRAAGAPCPVQERDGQRERVRADALAGHDRARAWPDAPHGIGGAADWLLCTDGKWRPVEPGTFPLAHGAPARVGRLRGYGNAIHAEVAATFIEAFRESRCMTDGAA